MYIYICVYIYGDLILLKRTNVQKMDKISNLAIKIFKGSFKIEIKINLKIVNNLDVTLKLKKGTYSP